MTRNWKTGFTLAFTGEIYFRILGLGLGSVALALTPLALLTSLEDRRICGLSNGTKLKDLEWPWRSLNWISCWQDFNWHSASRGPSAIAALLLLACSRVRDDILSRSFTDRIVMATDHNYPLHTKYFLVRLFCPPRLLCPGEIAPSAPLVTPLPRESLEYINRRDRRTDGRTVTLRLPLDTASVISIWFTWM